MKQDIKAKWIAALRSGTYQQAKHVLRDANGGFCCLGVLCDIYDQTKWIDRYCHTPNDSRWAYRTAEYETEGTIPEPVDQEIGIEFDVQEHLAQMNDTGKSFSEIADYIEQNL